jgi:peptidoglycan/LPS O-acetylase OafA/YrhL
LTIGARPTKLPRAVPHPDDRVASGAPGATPRGPDTPGPAAPPDEPVGPDPLEGAALGPFPGEPEELAPAPPQPETAAPPRRPDRPDDPRAERRRETDPLKVVPCLDGFRGYALIMVVFYHCWIAAFSSQLDGGPARNLVASFFIAVDMFFVISGFVLFLPTARDGKFGSVREYAWRRVARIAPAYYLNLIGFAVLFPFIAAPGTSGFWVREQLESWGVHALFLQRELLGSDTHGLYGFGSVIGFGYNGPLWSLSIEAVYYVMLPLVAIAFLRRPIVACVLALALGTLWRVGSWHLVPDLLPSDWSATRKAEATIGWAYQYPALMGHLALGMLAGWLYVKVLRSPEGSRLAWLHARASLLQIPAAALFIGSLIYSGHRDNLKLFTGAYFHYLRDVIPTIAFAVLVLVAALSSRRAQFAWSNPVMRWMGDVSYGAYLWHGMVLWIALWQFDWFPTSAAVGNHVWPFFRNFLFVFPMALLLGWLSYRFVEQPAIRWMRQRLRERRVRASAQPAGAKSG